MAKLGTIIITTEKDEVVDLDLLQAEIDSLETWIRESKNVTDQEKIDDWELRNQIDKFKESLANKQAKMKEYLKK